VRGCSIGWSSHQETAVAHASSGIYRILQARLLEVSIIIGAREPAFPGTWANVALG
jgi:hypothetical protein